MTAVVTSLPGRAMAPEPWPPSGASPGTPGYSELVRFGGGRGAGGGWTQRSPAGVLIPRGGGTRGGPGPGPHEKGPGRRQPPRARPCPSHWAQQVLLAPSTPWAQPRQGQWASLPSAWPAGGCTPCGAGAPLGCADHASRCAETLTQPGCPALSLDKPRCHPHPEPTRGYGAFQRDRLVTRPVSGLTPGSTQQ